MQRCFKVTLLYFFTVYNPQILFPFKILHNINTIIIDFIINVLCQIIASICLVLIFKLCSFNNFINLEWSEHYCLVLL